MHGSPLLSVSEMASRLGVHPQTLRRWSRTGILPESSRTPGNHRRYEVKAPKNGATIGYVRVSSHDQKSDLITQESMLKAKAAERGFPVSQVIADIGSGMNVKKKGFLKLMGMLLSGQVSHLVIMHKDRLLRFGSEIIFLICRTFNIKVTILEESPAKTHMEQLAADLVEIVTVFSSKLYGMRSHINRRNRKDAQPCSTSTSTV
jgi:predicted site-specific integrase-resolvase